jgi:trans-2,3-dihydro-3-hydroxyanthranilate isomerase
LSLTICIPIMAQNKLSPRQVVEKFLLEVRSGKYPERAKNYMNEKVLAHQVVSEEELTVERTPENYTAHIEDFKKINGDYTLEIIHLLSDGNKVFALWKQQRKHLAELDGYPPTGLPVSEVASCTYLVEDGKITEYWIQIDRLGLEKQLQKNSLAAGSNPMQYYHVDVFSDRSFSGNGLTVFPYSQGLSKENMQKITQEMRQFESIFLQQTEASSFRASIFTMEEELDFAGHPSLGAAAVLHGIFKPDEPRTTWTLQLNFKTIAIESRKTDYGYDVTMTQGKPLFARVLTKQESIQVFSWLNLTEDDWDTRYPVQVVSTGLPYLIVPVKQNLMKAKIVVNDLEQKLQSFGAKFVGPVEIGTNRIRTWNNEGMEDIATGSLAGPVGSFLVKYGSANVNEEIVLHEGANLGRPSELKVKIVGTTDNVEEVFVSGAVVNVGSGQFESRISAALRSLH